MTIVAGILASADLTSQAVLKLLEDSDRGHHSAPPSAAPASFGAGQGEERLQKGFSAALERELARMLILAVEEALQVLLTGDLLRDAGGRRLGVARLLREGAAGDQSGDSREHPQGRTD